MDYEALATAAMLLFGQPPKSLRHRSNLFAMTDAKAQSFADKVEKYVREQHPQATRTRTLNRRRRNDVLRAMYRQLGRPSK